MVEHAENCRLIRSGGGKKGGKGKSVELEGSKKRKAEDEGPEDPSAPTAKKNKPATKITKGRTKGPADLDKQCGVLTDKNLPCARALNCKKHSMGAKRAVQGRTRLYDDLLLDWNRAFNPNFVEPVKRETKAEKKEKRDKEKAEKKRLATEAALAAGPDGIKKSTSATGGTSTKKTGKKAAAAAAATRLAEGEDAPENYDDVDSEAEVDALVHSVRTAQSNGIIGVPLAVPCDAGSWFVARRERLRNCKDLLANALTPMTNRNGLSGTMVPGLRLP
ncbi:SCA7-domain-containing protein [Athelia psychrophila]|uniref:SCA7-domain-containing protein n=1 Tax=Athelia psychrophila TaxID=1759441 RepID=A0A166SCC1_9AGAM|nr:SCA7-domain-containing protein [Fibularhizoctonia sp. CBS 109695]